MVVPKVPDSEVAKSWFEAFVARAVHSAALSSTQLKATYRFTHTIFQAIGDLQITPDLEDDFFSIDMISIFISCDFLWLGIQQNVMNLALDNIS